MCGDLAISLSISDVLDVRPFLTTHGGLLVTHCLHLLVWFLFYYNRHDCSYYFVFLFVLQRGFSTTVLYNTITGEVLSIHSKEGRRYMKQSSRPKSLSMYEGQPTQVLYINKQQNKQKTIRKKYAETKGFRTKTNVHYDVHVHFPQWSWVTWCGLVRLWPCKGKVCLLCK